MAHPFITEDQARQATEAYKKHRTQTAAAEALGISRSTLGVRLEAAKAGRYIRKEDAELRVLRNQLASVSKEHLDADYVKKQILCLREQEVTIPDWIVRPPSTKKGKVLSGIPTLLASDWHWGEIVDPNQINGVNEYDLQIANKRARRLIEKTITLLNNHITNANYPGIIFALGGDMITGDIHEELTATNAKEVMPTIMDLFGVLIWCIATLKQAFGRVFVPCVTGNHGRNTKKIRSKGRNFTSFDWLLYCFLQKHFEGDKAIQFYIPDGSDAYYKVYDYRYLLTHGDQFRGGDGMIGHLGPVTRGDHKKRSRNAQIGMDYDTMIHGHFHTLLQAHRYIGNGSLIGYSEYSYTNNFGYEPPRQALWLTHPDYGITFQMGVYVEDITNTTKLDWVSIPKE